MSLFSVDCQETVDKIAQSWAQLEPQVRHAMLTLPVGFKFQSVCKAKGIELGVADLEPKRNGFAHAGRKIFAGNPGNWAVNEVPCDWPAILQRSTLLIDDFHADAARGSVGVQTELLPAADHRPGDNDSRLAGLFGCVPRKATRTHRCQAKVGVSPVEEVVVATAIVKANLVFMEDRLRGKYAAPVVVALLMAVRDQRGAGPDTVPLD